MFFAEMLPVCMAFTLLCLLSFLSFFLYFCVFTFLAVCSCIKLNLIFSILYLIIN